MSEIDSLIKKFCPDGVEYIELEQLADIDTGTHDTKEGLTAGRYPFYTRSAKPLFLNDYDYDETAIITAGDGEVGKNIHFVEGKYALHQRAYRIHIKQGHLMPRFLYHYMSADFYSYIQSQAFRSSVTSIRKPMLKKFPVPFPPMEVQEEIVRVLDSFTELEAELEAELEKRKKQYTYYRDRLLCAEDETEWVALGEISRVHDSERKPIKQEMRRAGSYPYYGASGVVDYIDEYLFDGDYLCVSEDGANLLARTRPIAFQVHGKVWINNHAHILEIEEYATRRLVEIYLNSVSLKSYINVAGQPKLTKEKMQRIRVQLPPLAQQRRLVELLDKFETFINDLTEGLPAEIAARHKQYEYYRDQLLTFDEIAAA